MKCFGELTAGCMLAVVLMAAAIALAQEAAPADADNGGEEMVELNLPEELTLKLLVDYVSKRQNVNFIFEGNLLNQSVNLKAPNKIPGSAMRTLMESVLKMKGLVVTETEVPGLFRIERLRQLQDIAEGPRAEEVPEDAGPFVAVTRLFEIEHTTPQRITQMVTPLLTPQLSTMTVLEEFDTVMVTDYARNMSRIERMIALIDRPGKKVETRFLAADHLAAKELSSKVNQLLQAEAQAAGAGRDPAKPTLLPDDRTNRIAVIGEVNAVEEAVSLIRMLDVPLGLETRIYAFDVAAPGRVDDLVRALIGELAAGRLYKSAIDDEANLLIATTTAEIHERIVALREKLDVPVSEQHSPVRFYKLENAKASEILTLLRDIEGGQGLEEVTVDGISADAGVERDAPRDPGGAAGDGGAPRELAGPTEAEVNRRDDEEGDAAIDELTPDRGAVELPEARILADDATNTLIVVAKPEIQAIYKRLIERLDIRRPQVLIEATVVVLDTTDDFSLGVEIFTDERANGGEVLNFTQFGLTTDESQPGAITLNPGTGFTGALLNANVAEVVIRALESDRRAKVVSRPSVLINDNATGTLVSQQEEPFETVSVSDTSVERTSFGGFASAGTDIKITPQISEGDHLKLEYAITLSSFREDAAASASTLPPSRQTNTLSSVATIPDGHTIVVGGLTRENFTNSIDRVPLLGSIPVLEYMFSSRRETTTRNTLFVFLHAVILRDDKFEDLKILSTEAAAQADIAGDFPQSEPVVIP